MRLTYRDSTVPHINAKGELWEAYSDYNYNEIINKLAAYEDAEEQGRLVMPPCKVGDTVFRIVPTCLGPYIQCPFEGGYGLDRCYNCDAFIKEESFRFFMLEDIGKTVFLTHEEAEAALKGEFKNELDT